MSSRLTRRIAAICFAASLAGCVSTEWRPPTGEPPADLTAAERVLYAAGLPVDGFGGEGPSGGRRKSLSPVRLAVSGAAGGATSALVTFGMSVSNPTGPGVRPLRGGIPVVVAWTPADSGAAAKALLKAAVEDTFRQALHDAGVTAEELRTDKALLFKYGAPGCGAKPRSECQYALSLAPSAAPATGPDGQVGWLTAVEIDRPYFVPVIVDEVAVMRAMAAHLEPWAYIYLPSGSVAARDGDGAAAELRLTGHRLMIRGGGKLLDF